jgi:hypothetical protein
MGSGGKAQWHSAVLASTLDGPGWSALRPWRFIYGERSLGTHWIGGWMCRSAVLDALVPSLLAIQLRFLDLSASSIPTELSRLRRLYFCPYWIQETDKHMGIQITGI